MKVIITGGAGYIGSNCTKILKDKCDVVVVDNLSRGHLDSIPGVKFYNSDIRNKDELDKVFKAEAPVDAVIHFAANSLVGESCEKPYEYFINNVYGTLELLKVMVDNNVKKIVFSSSAAVYGKVDKALITEDLPLNPSSPYGETKAMMESIMKWFDEAYGLKYVALRYFNVCGASSDGTTGEDHRPETHLIPIVIQTLEGKRDHLDVYGDDYETRDGTCIRDYINIEDLIDGHVKALEYLMDGGDSNVFNLGTKNGSSNLEIIKAVEEVSGKKIKYVMAGRRAGDPDSLVANADKARKILKWEPKHSLEDSLRSAILFHETHPNGYEK